MRWLLAPLRWWRMRRLVRRWCDVCEMSAHVFAEEGRDPCSYGWRHKVGGCLRGRVLYGQGRDRERAMREAGL